MIFENRLLAFLAAQNESEAGRNLDRLGTLTAYDIETLRMFFESDPIDVMLFCPKCGEIHIEKEKPDVCELCGVQKKYHDIGVVPVEYMHFGDNFPVWLNPPHKSHRCGNCNFVWRPADVP